MAVDRYALCVGINKYSDPEYNLNGCVNDANDWGALLTQQGYQVTKILDADATRENILAALQESVARLGYRDRLVFTYSGHGSWIPDRSGDEIDGRDEALVPHDFNLITDDALYPILSGRAYGSRIVTISDSCHSGTVTRGLAAFPNQWFEGGDTPRFLSPALLDVAPYDEIVEAAERGVSKALSRNSGVLLSGSTDEEYSYDAWFNRRPNGALTRAAIDRWAPGLTFRHWHESIRQALPSEDFPQTPQLGATSYQARNWVALD